MNTGKYIQVLSFLHHHCLLVPFALHVSPYVSGRHLGMSSPFGKSCTYGIADDWLNSSWVWISFRTRHSNDICQDAFFWHELDNLLRNQIFCRNMGIGNNLHWLESFPNRELSAGFGSISLKFPTSEPAILFCSSFSICLSSFSFVGQSHLNHCHSRHGMLVP